MLTKVEEQIDGLAYMENLDKRDNTNYAKALQDLYPGTQWAVSGTDYSTLHWADWNEQPKPSKKELDAKVKELELLWEQTQYRRDRAKNYPSISDQLDALWKGGDAAGEMLKTVMDIKSKYPKTQVD